VLSSTFQRLVSAEKRGNEHRRGVRVLFIANDSLALPILFSQGLPHLKALAERGHRICILSFEGAEQYYPGQSEQYRILRRQLAAKGIRAVAPPTWLFRIVPALAGKLVAGSLLAFGLALFHRIEVIHARSFFPALTALFCKRLLGIRMIFDMRSLYVDEQIPLGRLRSGTVKYRLMRWLEQQLLLTSDAIVAVSQPFAAHLCNRRDVWQEAPDNRIYVIPNCVDTQRFRPRPEMRRAQRQKLGLQDRTVLLAVMSWMSQRYGIREIVEFFHRFKTRRPDAFLLVLANRPPSSEAERRLAELGIDSRDMQVINANPTEVADLMQAADVGIFFAGSGFNQEIMFPIKFAEYLAIGLPVVINQGIRHVQEIVERERLGVIVDIRSGEGIKKGAQELHRFLVENGPEVRQRCRSVAERELSLDVAVGAYDRIYRRLGEPE
jgi:glycosyltransferase involved in cell wall biosynthesis